MNSHETDSKGSFVGAFLKFLSHVGNQRKNVVQKSSKWRRLKVQVILIFHSVLRLAPNLESVREAIRRS